MTLYGRKPRLLAGAPDPTKLWDLRPAPFPPLKVPPLIECKVGELPELWLLRKLPGRELIRGYFRGLQPLDHNWVLAKYATKDDAQTWMSITPMELESQSHHLVAAHGKVLVGGMGLGVLAYNLCQKGSVHEVLVVERDPMIAALAQHLASECAWPNWDKVRIVVADVLTLKMAERFDVALIDIWPGLGSMELRPDMQRIASQIAAKEYAAWGMELDFVSWCKEQEIDASRIQGRHYPMYCDAIGVPLIMKSNRRMAQYAVRAATNYVFEYLNPSA